MYKINTSLGFSFIKFKRHKNDCQIALKFSEFFISIHNLLQTSNQQLAAPHCSVLYICIKSRQIWNFLDRDGNLRCPKKATVGKIPSPNQSQRTPGRQELEDGCRGRAKKTFCLNCIYCMIQVLFNEHVVTTQLHLEFSKMQFKNQSKHFKVVFFCSRLTK